MTTYQQILANFQALGYSSDSVTAIFKKQAEAISITVDNTKTEILNSETIINNIITLQRYGKAGYYTGKALAFQYGDSLTVDPVTLDDIYLTIDTTKQIIKQAAFEDITGSLFLKVATQDIISGDLIALTTDQFNAFSSYFTTFQIPGLPVSIISNSANLLNFNTICTYYATFDLPSLKTNIQNAMTLFRQSFQFNGEFFNGDLSDYIKQNVPGVRDFYLSNTAIDSVPFSGSKSLDAGYFNYISTIFDQITYTAI